MQACRAHIRQASAAGNHLGDRGGWQGQFRHRRRAQRKRFCALEGCLGGRAGLALTRVRAARRWLPRLLLRHVAGYVTRILAGFGIAGHDALGLGRSESNGAAARAARLFRLPGPRCAAWRMPRSERRALLA